MTTRHALAIGAEEAMDIEIIFENRVVVLVL
jgi:hypothetical protein